DEGMRHAKAAPCCKPFKRRKALAEGKPRGSIVGVVAGYAAIKQKAAERDHEWLQAHSGNQEPIDQSDQCPCDEDDQDGQRPGELVGNKKVDEDYAEQ